MENNQLPIIAATKDGFNRFADFSGVSTRSQYWYFVLSTTIATLLPTIAVAVRRMHDVGKSGWFILIPIYNLILATSPSKPANNSF
jgi:uncharacterized membrane protein YhaH (DUF805 family)